MSETLRGHSATNHAHVIDGVSCVCYSVNNTHTKRCRLTHIHAHGTHRRMGRRKEFHERINLTLPDGAKEAIDSVLQKDEDRNAFVRSAIVREIRRRQEGGSAVADPSSDQFPGNTLATALDQAASHARALLTAVDEARVAASTGKLKPRS